MTAKRKRKPYRTRYEVAPTGRTSVARGALPWKVTRNGAIVATRDRKRLAVELATTTARCAWQTNGQRSTLKIKGRDGRIREERTYGHDPIRTKG